MLHDNIYICVCVCSRNRSVLFMLAVLVLDEVGSNLVRSVEIGAYNILYVLYVLVYVSDIFRLFVLLKRWNRTVSSIH
jgi:hypothetical protein